MKTAFLSLDCCRRGAIAACNTVKPWNLEGADYTSISNAASKITFSDGVVQTSVCPEFTELDKVVLRAHLPNQYQTNFQWLASETDPGFSKTYPYKDNVAMLFGP